MDVPIGTRVNVMLGDIFEPLSKGVIVDYVSVYFARMPDGHIVSLADAESEPPAEWVAYLKSVGVEIIKMPNNAKIKLDSGEIRYGCQVWWSTQEAV